MRKQWNSVQRFSLRKFSTGLASVLLATMFMSQGVMAQSQSETEGNVATESVKPNAEKESPARGKDAVGTEKEVAPLSGVGNAVNKKETINNGSLEEKTPEVPIEKSENKLNKKNLEELLKEIDQLNLKDYTEATVKVLQEKVAKAKDALVNAKSQKEISSAYNALVEYKNTGLKRVPKLKEVEHPKPDTTNGKETVGIRAENTEPNGTNIAGHNHSLNGTTRAAGSGFRDANTELTDVEIGRWNATRKKFDEGNVYGVYPGDNLRNNSLKIKVKSPNANITKLTVTKKEGQNFPGEHTTGIGGKEADLYFEGNLPNSGSWLMEVTAETTKGIKKFEFGVYTHFQAPTIKTENNALVGKANGKPNIDVEIPSVPKLPEGSRMMLYVVGRGAEDYGQGFEPDPAYSLVKAKKQIASGKEGTGGKKTVTITKNDYTVEKLGTEPFKVLTVIELIGSDGNYKEDHRPGLRGSFYSSIRSATEAPTVDKSGAINAITTEAEKQNSLIDSKQNVFTSTEVTDFKTMVTNAAQTAKDNINKTDTDTDTKVNAERDKGILALDKIGAIVEVEAAKKAKDTAIENNTNITDKATAKAAIQTAAEAAKTEINKTETNTADKVTTEKAKGLLGIEKAGAIAEIDAAKAAKDTAIEGNANITDKAAAKAATKAAAEAAKAEINKTETNTADKVTTEKEKGLLGLEKAGAIAEIDAAQKAKDAAIDNNANITDKDVAKAATKAAAEAAKAEINKTETNTADKVTTEKEKGLLGLEKAGAIAEIDAAQKAKDAAIDNNANITDKAAAKAAIQTAADAAKTEINKDTTNTAALVTTEKEKGLLGLERAGAIAKIDAARATKDAAIETNIALTPSEKAEVKAEVEKIRSKAIADITREKDVKSIEKITDAAVEAILNARPRYNFTYNSNHSSTTNTNHSQSDNDMMKALLAKKSEAKMLIEQEAMKKKAEISQVELSESEKALLNARVDQEKAIAFQMIDQETTIEEVDHALMAGIEVIRSIAVASANGRMTGVTPEESEEAMAQAHRQALPQTGTGNEAAIFGAAASAILAGLGLVVPSKKKED